MEGKVVVSTGDLKQDYEIIGPVYFQISNKPEGFDPSTLSEYKEKYVTKLNDLKKSGKFEEASEGSAKWGCVWGEWCLGQGNFELAFFISVEELKQRTEMLGGDGVIFMRQDIDLSFEAIQYFSLQMYGTAVKIKESQ